MISYNTKDWFTFIFRFHKAETFRTLLPIMFAIGVYAAIIGYAEVEYWKLAENSYVKNITIMHGMLGFVISLLLVFRTNTAYDRWWEGRKLWGSLVNNSRNFSIKLCAILEDENDKKFFRKIIPSYANVLQKHLKNEDTAKQLFEDLDLEIDHHKHKPNQVAMLMFQKINELYVAKKITGDQLIILNAEIQSFTEVCGACERIKNTPIPYSYSAFIKKFIFFYVMTLPFGYSFSLGYYV
ncbi:MAG: bestrophin family protein, partial [Flavobacterium sp.]